MVRRSIPLSALLVLLVSILWVGAVAAQEPGFELSYEVQARTGTTPASAMFKVLSPEGARCEVAGDLGDQASKEVPFSMPAKENSFYAFTCKLPSGAVWKKKLEAKSGQLATLKIIDNVAAAATVTATTPGGTVSVAVNAQTTTTTTTTTTEPAPAKEPAKPAAIDAARFNALKQAIGGASFSDDKLNALRSAANSSWFTIDQTGQIIDLFSFANDKVEAVRILKARIIDVENAFMLQGHFSFSSDKETVQKIFQP